ncbi:uncharacterized protein UV8b_07759 [Ustilaginoidea virens]|uniref:Conserved oligomeric Golgi complex subunit 5 n=1 Tax=Ustilaginoidea virens TaxID=1159556 RepID=A0A063BUJ2_USTVR|nr:uncharacterized protein UV8b_07759 [Ustilaginoidea virens]QUC23518.1 hypothetical protein UV8b_07759 [Ustilaginoidea virens]GAO15875.1 hypothetical protein UVI_02051450 [Ustilaginoidea virens]
MASPDAPAGLDEPSYIDYEAFLSPDFSPAAFANSLVLATNNPTDTPLDLSTPLSRVLFDAQEIDSHIDLVTTRSAVPLLDFTKRQNQASRRIVSELGTQLTALNDSYKQLEKEVVGKHAAADEVRHVALRLWETLRLGRAVGRCLQLGRQLEVQHAELGGAGSYGEDGALVRCSHTVLSLREVLDAKAPGEEGHGLGDMDAVRTLQDARVAPMERAVRETAERLVRDFAVPANTTFSQGEEARLKLESAMTALYLLSPTSGIRPERWTPRLLLAALEAYIRSSLQAGITVLSRSLGQLPSLDRALAEVTAKCQNIIALEIILQANKPPPHPLLPTAAPQNPAPLIQLLLAHLETGSLASYFWRTMAGSLATRVQDILSRGGVVARTLRANKANVADAVRQAVIQGSQPPAAFVTGRNKRTVAGANWDREVAVMVGSVTNSLR